jgi:hypothetical protein
MMTKQSTFLMTLAIVGVVAFNALVVIAAFACGDDDGRLPASSNTASSNKG